MAATFVEFWRLLASFGEFWQFFGEFWQLASGPVKGHVAVGEI